MDLLTGSGARVSGLGEAHEDGHGEVLLGSIVPCVHASQYLSGPFMADVGDVRGATRRHARGDTCWERLTLGRHVDGGCGCRGMGKAAVMICG